MTIEQTELFRNLIDVEKLPKNENISYRVKENNTQKDQKNNEKTDINEK